MFKQMTVLLIAMFVVACAETLPDGAQKRSKINLAENEALISQAYWDSETATLTITGKSRVEEKRVELKNSINEEKLGRTNVTQEGSWFLSINDLSSVPCSVTAQTAQFTETQVVENASINCNRSNIKSRENVMPVGHILNPTGDRVINVGDTITFQGHGVAATQNTALTFAWDFNGATRNQNQQNPGDVQFNQAGEFVVRLQVADGQGAVDAAPPERIIRVLANNNRAPNSRILSPVNDMVINVGDSVRFQGAANDPDGNNPLSFNWNFDNAVADNNQQNPGNVQFNQAGNFRVRFQARDNLGVADQTPDQRMISVVNNDAQINQEPDSTIVNPVRDMIINVGDSIQFNGQGNDPNGNSPLLFDWNFGGGARNIQQQNPGNIQFNQAGDFQIRMRVTNNQGLRDTTPAQRRIQVLGQNIRNQAPESFITNPPGNMTINVGDQVRLRAQGNDPDGNNPLQFLWTIGTRTANSQDLGNVQFNRVGTVRVRMQVMDNTGLRDPTPVERIIEVVALNAGVQNQAPNSHILNPVGDITINVGDAVRFAGHGVDPNGNGTLQFAWNFDGATANDNVQDPGDIVFDQAGTFRVRMAVTDQEGLQDPTPAERIISVMGNNRAPNSRILRPVQDLLIRVGSVVNFQGGGNDPDQDTPLAFQWQFGNAGLSVDRQNPGNVRFNQAGNFRVQLRVIDNLGMGDPTPDERRITVR